MEIFGIRRRLRNLLRDAREADQLRVQLAGVSVAALGGTSPAVVVKRGQYGWSVAYQDVLGLRRQYDDFRNLVVDLAKAWSQCKCEGTLCVHERAHLLVIKPRHT